MARSMSASDPYGSMTRGQIRELTARFRATLEAHAADIRLGVAQEMLGRGDVGMIAFSAIRKLADELDRVRRVSTVEIPTARAFDLRAQELDFRFWTNSDETISCLSATRARRATLVYFESMAETVEQLVQEYAQRNLVADPWAQMADYGSDREFRSDSRCLWQRPDGQLTRFKFYYPDARTGGREGYVEVTRWSSIFRVRGTYAGVPIKK